MSTQLPNDQTLLEIIRIQTEIVKAGMDLGAVMALITEHSQKLTHADGAVIEICEGDEMVYRATSGIANPQLGLRISRTGSLSGRCVAEASIMYCADARTDDRVDRRACEAVGLLSMIVVPLMYRDDVVGVLKVLSKQVDAFDTNNQFILKMMSELVAASMFHAARFETNELYFHATHDAMTGLANRSLFFDRLRVSMARSIRHNESIAILNLDMDGLKSINDLFGHRAGDAAIKEFARRIESIVRETDTVARFGGDEFMILLNKVGDRAGAEKHIHRLFDKIHAPFEFESNSLTIDASIGLAIFPEDGKTIEDLIEKSDRAMYQQKRSKKTTGIYLKVRN
ncbi:sensor domain-containing diguanylate cyclase [Undibacterium flavidum]|uniref:GGDEF domain-containing protein n=1 Tax=Undibacterium flavidum TaxID=2762297 RepID=A0ABR6YB27_9BURK|nr:sensor domain-containing diguanylate cyclase [Undibacterium flavidum]MBC3873796.1 GGDEF domain-containing protein [Undibacterium flavidum]